MSQIGSLGYKNSMTIIHGWPYSMAILVYEIFIKLLLMHIDCCCSKFCHCWSGNGSFGFGGSAAICSSIVSETEIALHVPWIIGYQWFDV